MKKYKNVNDGMILMGLQKHNPISLVFFLHLSDTDDFALKGDLLII